MQQQSKIETNLVKNIILWFAIAYLCFGIGRCYSLLQLRSMEDDGYVGERGTGFHNFMTNGALLFTLAAPFYAIFIARELRAVTTNFQSNFESRQQIYLDGGSVMRQFDKMQMAFQCCGSTGYQSWFEVDLHAKMNEIDNQEYWEARMKCHYREEPDKSSKR